MTRPTLRQRHRWLQRGFNHAVYYLAAGLVALLGVCLRWLPHRWLVALGRPLGWLAARLARAERRRALANLARVWPTVSAPRRERIVGECFVNLGRSALECLVLDRVLARPGACRLTSAAHGALRGALDGGRGVIFATGHYGNWELMAGAVARLAPVYVLARQSYDPRFTRLIERLRLRHGVRCLWVERPMHLKRAVRLLRRDNAVVGILIDQPVDTEHRPGFLGQPAPTTEVVAGLARLSGAAVVAGFVERVAPARHRVSITRCEPRGVGATLEGAIRRHPELWLWTLDRWRFGTREEANQSSEALPASTAGATEVGVP